MEVITESEFNRRMDTAIIYGDLLGEQHVIRLGMSQTQLLARYAVQLELNYGDK